MVAGDDFTQGPLSITNDATPNARYLVTHVYYPGARSISGALALSWDSDPYETGESDAHRGIPVGTDDTMVQNSQGLALKVRWANASETPYINGRVLVSGMIASGAYLTFSPPAIIEGYISLTSGAPAGWHPSFWIAKGNPLDTDDSMASPGSLEFDISENSSDQNHYSFVPRGSTTGPGSFSTNLGHVYFGNGLHLFTLVMTASNAQEYIDGFLVGTIGQDTTNTHKPFYVLLTGHSYNDCWGSGDPCSVDQTGWQSLGATGATITAQYYRIWLPSASSGQIIQPRTSLSAIKVGYGQTFSYTFPSASSLWGSGIADYCQAFRFEDFEPGGSYSTGITPSNGTTAYYPFPSELSWNSGTRTLSGAITSHSGRLHVGCNPYESSSVGYTAPGYIDVGPTIPITSLPTATHGTGYSYDLYVECYAGTLLPKTITVSGLPSGMAFSNSTGYITGTPSAAGSYTVAVTVTNSVGQSASQNLSLTVN